MKFKHLILPIVLSLVVVSSCIDENYDISKLPKELIVAGDSITFPIGKIDSGMLRSFMNEQDIQYIEVRDGFYFVSYRDSVNLPVPTKEELRVNDFTNSTSSPIQYHSSVGVNTNYTTPTPINSTFNGTNTIPIVTNNVILRVDSVEFSSKTSESLITLSLMLNQIQLSPGNGSYDLEFNLHLPDGFVLENLNGSTISNPYKIIETKTDNSPINRIFKLRRFKKSSANIILSYDGSIKINANSTIKYTSTTPTLNISISGTNLYIEALKGQMNYGPIITTIKKEMKSLYTFFKTSEDVISFYNPTFDIQTKTDFSIPITANINVSTKGGTATTPSSINLEIVPPTTFNSIKINHFSIGQEDNFPRDPSSIWHQLNFRDYLKAIPDTLVTAISYRSKIGSGGIDSPHFIRNNSIGKAYYRFDLPIAFYNDFQFSFCDTIHNIFNDDIKKYLFSLGTVYLTGDVVTTLPLNAEFSATILSQNYATPPITVSSKVIYKATNRGVNRSPFKLEIKPEELATMLHPRHFSAKIIIKSDRTVEGIALKATDFIHLENLKITKKGGFKVDL